MPGTTTITTTAHPSAMVEAFDTAFFAEPAHVRADGSSSASRVIRWRRVQVPNPVRAAEIESVRPGASSGGEPDGRSMVGTRLVLVVEYQDGRTLGTLRFLDPSSAASKEFDLIPKRYAGAIVEALRTAGHRSSSGRR